MPYGFHEILNIIFPGVKTQGHNLTIPMPGHPISDSIRQKVQEDYEKLEALISRYTTKIFKRFCLMNFEIVSFTNFFLS